MKKKLKKIVVFIIIAIIIIIKIFQINFIEKVKNKIENFEKLENSYCNQILLTKNQKNETTRIFKNKKMKEIISYSNSESVIRLIDLNKNKQIIIEENSNLYSIEENKENIDTKINNLPWIIEILDEIKKEIRDGNIFYLFHCFKIIYILPTQYNEIDCYKIKTTREILYVDRDTLYPIYLEYNQSNSNKSEDITNIQYVFKENNVKDEDIKFPNLNNYKLFDEEANKSK